MVNKIHYRWDFFGLSTDTKPTPDESPKVVNGSTYYESDTSKLFVFYKDTWYERKPLGGGGGGSSYTAGDGIEIENNTISVDTEVVQPKLTAGTNITIDENNVISAEGGSSVNVVQTTGTSTTDVMSQKAATDMLYPLSTTKEVIRIGDVGAASYGSYSIGIGTAVNASANSNIAIGNRANASGMDSVAIGHWSGASNGDNTVAIGGGNTNGRGAHAQGTGGVAIGGRASIASAPGGLVKNYNTAIGYNATAGAAESNVAIGAYAKATEKGQFDISTLATTNTYGYNNSQYRLLTGLYDPQNAHDAATKGYVDTKLGSLTLVSLTQSAYDALTTKDPNTLYIITGA